MLLASKDVIFIAKEAAEFHLAEVHTPNHNGIKYLLSNPEADL